VRDMCVGVCERRGDTLVSACWWFVCGFPCLRDRHMINYESYVEEF